MLDIHDIPAIEFVCSTYQRDKAYRQQQLAALLDARALSARELVDRVEYAGAYESQRRAVYRDLRDLESLGFIVQTDTRGRFRIVGRKADA